MSDSETLELAGGDRKAARSDDQTDLIKYAGHRPLDWAIRNFHPVSLAATAAVALRAPRSGVFAGWWGRLIKDLVKPYRPELHYMRGRGPKWREKHGQGVSFDRR
jgi:hypothetical protein